MGVPSWRTLGLDAEIIAEPDTPAGRLVLWLPAGQDAEFVYWERVGTAAGAVTQTTGGLGAVAATSTRARRRLRRRLLLWGRGQAEDRACTLPDGTAAEWVGNRQADLALAWTEEGTGPLDEARLRARWPACREVRPLGTNLALVRGVEPPRTGPPPEVTPPGVTPRDRAEWLLNAARRAGDAQAEAASLTDLGITLRMGGDVVGAVASLEAALNLARRIGDRPREGDALGNLGLAALDAGQPERALGLFEEEETTAREAGDEVARKLAQEHLGIAWTGLGDPARALRAFEEALGLARRLGDRAHEATLLWHAAIVLAEHGDPTRAAAMAQESIDLLNVLGRPQAAWYAEQLSRFRAGQAVDLGVGRIDVAASAPASVRGPGPLRMAFTAAKAMARFLGSGLKVSPEALARAREHACSGCPHHTGLRCRVCGCFTAAKARMLHEDCPLGRWPAQPDSSGRG